MKSAARNTLLVAAFLAVPLSVARAFPDDGGAPPPPVAGSTEDGTKPVRDAFAAFQEAAKTAQAVGRDPEKRKPAIDAANKARDDFAKLFAAANWDGFDPAKDADLLKAGLQISAAAAMNADDPKSAAHAYETLIAKFPDLAGRAGMQLANAYAATGDVAKAKSAFETAAEKADEKMKPYALVSLGDFQASQGDLEGARKSWQAAQDASPKCGADIRIELVGKPAPEIDSKTWMDGDAKPLSALKGHVVIVDFWATWCPPCRDVMPGLNKLYEAKKAAGLMVLGVTHYYANGFMPKAGTKDPMRDGEQVKGITEEGFLDHVKQFKTNVGITYPFVITGKEGAEATAYHVSGIPTMAVIDVKGDVAFVKVGSGNEALLKLAVDRLTAPAPAK